MSVFLDNVDDFIAPSQACVNPFVANKVTEVSNSNKKLIISVDQSKSEFETKLVSELKPNLIKSKISSSSQKIATVSLNDCLACRFVATVSYILIVRFR